MSKCRTCLQECSRYHHLEEYAENNLKILEMLDEIVPQIHIRIPSQFSHLMCGVCVDKLLNGYKFQQLCIDSNKRLHTVLGNDKSPTEIEVASDDTFDPLMGENKFKMKQELSDNVKLECEINSEEIAENLISNDACSSVDEAEERDTDSSNELLSVLSDRKLDEVFEGSEPKKRPKKIRRKCVFPCTECGKVFDRLNGLKRHSVVHAKNRDFSCDICKYRFATEKLYIAHMRVHVMDANDSTNSLVLICALCNESFESITLLVEHTQKHRRNLNNLSKKKGNNKDSECTKKEQHQMKPHISNSVGRSEEKDKDENNTDFKKNMVIKQEVDISHPKENEDALEKKQNSDNTGDEDEDYEYSLKFNNIDTGTGGNEKPNQNRRTGNCPCEVCGKVFDRPSGVKRHSSVHSLERSHACELCTYRFATPKLLKIHMIQHESKIGDNSTAQSPPDDFKCPECPRRFENHASLSAHRQIHTEANYTCTVCQSNFISVRSLTGHIINKHPEVEKHKCDQCDKSFVLQEHLMEHLNRHKCNRNLVCLICGKEFGHSNTLKKHMLTHSNVGSFLCPHCGKTFKTSSNLSQHMKRHVGLKKCQCPECPSQFNCRSDLITHMSSHRKVKPHQCDVCGSRFTRSSSLQKHKSLHTGEKPYRCSQCNMAFAVNFHLRRHMRTHTGEKPYKCKHCERAYAESGDLNKHLRTHVGENTYMCDQCPLAFKYNAELRQHVSEHFRTAHIQKMSEESQ